MDRPTPDVAQAWEAEILRRIDQIDQGEANFLTPEEVIERVRKRLANA